MIRRPSKQSFALAAALAVFSLSACNGPAADRAADAGPRPPGWLAGLPERSVEAAPGETVWAVVPEAGSEAARLGTYRLESAAGAEAVLTDALGTVYEGVPGALVHPLSSFPEAELAAGTAVLADRLDAGGIVGRVTGLEAGTVEVAYDWNGVTVTSSVDAVMALPAIEGSLALRWVRYRTGGEGAWYQGLCFAESETQAWISTDGGYVEVVAMDAVQPLVDLGRGELQAGDAVAAYSWGHGYRPGVIEEVLEPGLRYAVKLEGGEIRPVFFDSLTAEPL